MRRDDLSDIETREVRRALRLLRSAEVNVGRALDAHTRGTPRGFDNLVALQRKQAIDREIDSLEAELNARTRKTAATVTSALAPAGRVTPILGLTVGISTRAIVRASQSAALEVRGVTNAVRADVNRAILRALTGELDGASLDKEIRRAFRKPVTDARIARILRTEIGEIFTQQQAERHVQLAASGADLIKVWMHKHAGRRMFAGNGRPLFREDHVLVHGQERELLEEFDVGGGATAATPPGGGTYHPSVPMDPALPAEQRIHCGCESIEIPRAEAKQAYTASNPPASILENAAQQQGGASRAG